MGRGAENESESAVTKRACSIAPDTHPSSAEPPHNTHDERSKPERYDEPAEADAEQEEKAADRWHPERHESEASVQPALAAHAQGRLAHFHSRNARGPPGFVLPQLRCRERRQRLPSGQPQKPDALERGEPLGAVGDRGEPLDHGVPLSFSPRLLLLTPPGGPLAPSLFADGQGEGQEPQAEGGGHDRQAGSEVDQAPHDGQAPPP